MKTFHLGILVCFVMTACSSCSSVPPARTNLSASDYDAEAMDTPTATAMVKPGWLAFQGKYIWLMHPDSWSSEVLAGDAPFLRIESNFDDVNLNIARTGIDRFRDAKTLEDIDKRMWDGILRLYELAGQRDTVKLESWETIEVGGQPATKRLFKALLIKDPSQPVHKMLVLVVQGEYVYQITANADSENGLRGAEVTQIIDSIRFAR